MTESRAVGSGVAIGRLSQFAEKPFSLSVGTERGQVRVTILDNGNVQVVQGEKVTDLPHSGGI